MRKIQKVRLCLQYLLFHADKEIERKRARERREQGKREREKQGDRERVTTRSNEKESC